MTALHRRLLYPKTIALIGASADADSVGGRVTRAALASIQVSYADIQIYLVNPKHRDLYDRPCLASTAELPIGVDLAVIMTPWSEVARILPQLVARRVANVVCISVATESGWPWESRQGLLNKLQRQLKGAPLRWLGPASPGLMLSHQGINLSLCASFPSAGGVAYLGASDAVTSALAQWAVHHGVGFSHALTFGDEVDLSLDEAMGLMQKDAPTKVVLIYLEAVPDISRFLSCLRALAYRKPVAVLRSGLHDANERALWFALVRRCGALPVSSLDELCAAAHLDLPNWTRAGEGFSIVGNSQALLGLAEDAVIHADALIAELSKKTLSALKKLSSGVPESGRGVHLGRDAGPRRYSEAIQILATNEHSDVLLLVHHATAFSDSQLLAQALALLAEKQLPILAALVGPQMSQALLDLSKHGIAAFTTPDAAVRSYLQSLALRRLRARLITTPAPMPKHRTALDDAKKGALLAAGLPVSTDLKFWFEQLVPAEILKRARDALRFYGLRLRMRRSAVLGRFLQLIHHDEVLALVPLPLNQVAIEELLRATDRYMASDAKQAVFELLRDINESWMLAPRWHFCEFPDLSVEFADAPSKDILSAPSPQRQWLSTASGNRLLLRDIRAEDEPALSRGFSKLSPEEVRMRFMFPLKHLTHELAAQLTQLDYFTDVALVLCTAEAPGHAEIFAVVRASIQPFTRSAEFAIVIPRPLSGQGLGAHLMKVLIDRLRQFDVRELWGSVLSDNVAMLALARKLGFSVESDAQDASLMVVRLAL